MDRNKFLPISKEDMAERGWSEADFVIVTGDAYCDHPSFGTAIIGRVLEARGYKVAILAQPDFHSADDFKRLGRPRLGFLINSGAVDSMVNHYSVFKNRRKRDEYSPGGVAGKRPDRAVIVYSQRAREAYKDVPIMIGGIEASLRRLAHYDYWDDKVRRSILLDSKADILMYGMGERSVVEIAEALEAGIAASDIGWIRGTCVKGKISELGFDLENPDDDTIVLPSFQEVSTDKSRYCDSFALSYYNNDCINGKRLIEPYENNICVIQNPPQEPLEREELDDVYAYPYVGTYHPIYEKDGGVPGIQEVKFSIASVRGCFGGCAFCAITYHQGREVRSRSKESIVAEAEKITKYPDFKGYIHDVGGPTANFRHPACEKQLTKGVCKNKDCLYPTVCKNMKVDHTDYLDVLRAVRGVPGVKKVFIRSGIRYDYAMADKSDEFIREVCKYHVSGVLKVAPEHLSPRVLSYMRKPPIEVFDAFAAKYKKINEELGKKQYLVPYLISSHPGSTLDDAIDLALYLKKTGFVPDQVQDFYPTPSTLATCMYYTEMDPFTKEPVYVAKKLSDKKMQRALMHFHKRENKETVLKALKVAGREEVADILYGNAEHAQNRNIHRQSAGKSSGNSHKGKSNGKQAGKKK